MLKNNLKIAFRQLKKQKFYSAVNIMGLAIGVTCCLLIALYVQDELSFDKYHPNVENLYRLGRDIKMEDFDEQVLIVSAVLPKEMMAQIPEVKNYARITQAGRNGGSNLVRKVNESNNLFEDGFVYADQTLFEMFHLPLVHGDKNNILTKPRTIVVSEEMAQKYFPNKNPVGEVLVLNDSNEETFTVTGVMENIREQTHLQADFFISMPTLVASDTSNTYLNNSYYAYVTLTNGTKPEDLKSKFYDFVHQNFAPQFKQFVGLDMKELERNGQYMKLFLQPVEDAHLKSTELWPAPSTIGDIKQVRLFGSIAIFILLIALFNFVNLSTARSANRAKEVGLRKVLGSYQKQLVTQFLTESVLTSLFSFGIGFLLAIFLLPRFNEVTAKAIDIPFTAPSFIALFVGSALLVGFLAGLYPAFYLSKFEPVKVLKGKLSLGSKSSWLQSGLVVFQFAISIILIVSVLVVYQQIEFIQNKKLGFNKNNVVHFKFDKTESVSQDVFISEIKNLPSVINASSMWGSFVNDVSDTNGSFNWDGKNPDYDPTFHFVHVNYDMLEMLNVEMAEGRAFSKKYSNEDKKIILNEKGAKLIGLEDPVGKTFNLWGTDYEIIGIAQNFHFESLYQSIQPFFFRLIRENRADKILVKIQAGQEQNTLAQLESMYKKNHPNVPFEYHFLDTDYQKLYESEQRVATLAKYFAGFAILLSCLGLFGLAAFTAQRRIKEISIRKVLGAKPLSIVSLLTLDFTKMVLVGIFIGLPVSYFITKNWLEEFVFHIDLSLWFFLFAGVTVLVIAWITVGLQTVKAANVNPVNNLKE